MYRDWRQYREAIRVHLDKLVEDGIIPRELPADLKGPYDEEEADRMGEALLRRGIPVEMHTIILPILGRAVGERMDSQHPHMTLDEASFVVMRELYRVLGLEDTPVALQKLGAKIAKGVRDEKEKLEGLE